jgi:Uma2 family endonuclease
MFHISVERYHEMIRTGVLTDDDRVELLENLLVFKMSKNPPHASSATRCRDAVADRTGHRFAYRVQDRITLDDGEPEPDVVAAKGPRSSYDQRHPIASDIILIIEVADTSLDRDRGVKFRSYSRAGIKQYWIVNLIDKVVEAYTDPTGPCPEPTYRQGSTIPIGASAAFTLDDGESVSVPVAELFGA